MPREFTFALRPARELVAGGAVQIGFELAIAADQMCKPRQARVRERSEFASRHRECGSVERFDDVDRVYQDAHGRYDQILIETDRPDIFLVVVVDVRRNAIHGHRLLDLNVEYGLIPGTG